MKILFAKDLSWTFPFWAYTCNKYSATMGEKHKSSPLFYKINAFIWYWKHIDILLIFVSRMFCTKVWSCLCQGYIMEVLQCICSSRMLKRDYAFENFLINLFGWDRKFIFYVENGCTIFYVKHRVIYMSLLSVFCKLTQNDIYSRF